MLFRPKLVAVVSFQPQKNNSSLSRVFWKRFKSLFILYFRILWLLSTVVTAVHVFDTWLHFWLWPSTINSLMVQNYYRSITHCSTTYSLTYYVILDSYKEIRAEGASESWFHISRSILLRTRVKLIKCNHTTLVAEKHNVCSHSTEYDGLTVWIVFIN